MLSTPQVDDKKFQPNLIEEFMIDTMLQNLEISSLLHDFARFNKYYYQDE